MKCPDDRPKDWPDRANGQRSYWRLYAAQVSRARENPTDQPEWWRVAVCVLLTAFAFGLLIWGK